MEIETLHKTEWVELRRMKDPENGVHGYDYLHESRCRGIVAILPVRSGENPDVLMRREVTPCWGMTEALSSITGGIDHGNTPLQTCVHELAEEAG